MISVEDLLAKIDDACAKMGQSNPNRLLFAQCRSAIVYLATLAPDDLLASASRHVASRIVRP